MNRFEYLFIYIFIYLFIYLFIYSCIYSFICEVYKKLGYWDKFSVFIIKQWVVSRIIFRGWLFQPWLWLISLGSVWKKFELYVITTYILQLLITEYLRNININFSLFKIYLYFSCIEKFFEERRNGDRKSLRCSNMLVTVERSQRSKKSRW